MVIDAHRWAGDGEPGLYGLLELSLTVVGARPRTVRNATRTADQSRDSSTWQPAWKDDARAMHDIQRAWDVGRRVLGCIHSDAVVLHSGELELGLERASSVRLAAPSGPGGRRSAVRIRCPVVVVLIPDETRGASLPLGPRSESTPRGDRKPVRGGAQRSRHEVAVRGASAPV